MHQAAKLFKRIPMNTTSPVWKMNNQGQWCGPRSDEAWNDVGGPIHQTYRCRRLGGGTCNIYIYIHMIIVTFTHTHMLVLKVFFIVYTVWVSMVIFILHVDCMQNVYFNMYKYNTWDMTSHLELVLKEYTVMIFDCDQRSYPIEQSLAKVAAQLLPGSRPNLTFWNERFPRYIKYSSTCLDCLYLITFSDQHLKVIQNGSLKESWKVPNPWS